MGREKGGREKNVKPIILTCCQALSLIILYNKGGIKFEKYLVGLMYFLSFISDTYNAFNIYLFSHICNINTIITGYNYYVYKMMLGLSQIYLRIMEVIRLRANP
jgi:hypothetical protein